MTSTLNSTLIYMNSPVMDALVSDLLRMNRLNGIYFNIILIGPDGSMSTCWKYSYEMNETSIGKAIEYLSGNIQVDPRLDYQQTSICLPLEEAFDSLDRSRKQSFVVVANGIKDIEKVQELFDKWFTSKIAIPKPMFVVFNANAQRAACARLCAFGDGFVLYPNAEYDKEELRSIFNTIGINTTYDVREFGLSRRYNKTPIEIKVQHNRIQISKEFKINDNDVKVRLTEVKGDGNIFIELTSITDNTNLSYDNLDDIPLNIEQITAIKKGQVEYERINHYPCAIGRDSHEFLAGFYDEVTKNQLLLDIRTRISVERGHDDMCTYCISRGSIESDDQLSIPDDDIEGRNATMIETISRILYGKLRNADPTNDKDRKMVDGYISAIEYLCDQHNRLDKNYQKTYIRWVYFDALLQTTVYFLSDDGTPIEKMFKMLTEYSKRVAETMGDYSPERYALACLNFARYHMRKKEYKASLEKCNEALHVLEKYKIAVRDTIFYKQARLIGSNIKAVAGNSYKLLKDYDKGEIFLQESLEERIKILPRGHVDIGNSMKYLATLYGEKKEFTRAFGMLTDAMKIYENLGDRAEIASVKYQQANLWLKRSRRRADNDSKKADWKRAYELYLDVIEIREHLFGSKAPSLAGPLQSVGSLAAEMEQFDKAVKYHLRALEIRRKQFEQGELPIASVCNNLGRILKKMKKEKEAYKYLKEAYDIRLTKLGPDHADTLETEGLLKSLEEDQRASSVFDRVELEPLNFHEIDTADKKKPRNNIYQSQRTNEDVDDEDDIFNMTSNRGRIDVQRGNVYIDSSGSRVRGLNNSNSNYSFNFDSFF